MSNRAIKILKCVVFPLCLVPLALLIWFGVHQNLGADPVAEITHTTGNWTMYFLLISLAITPVRRLHPKLALLIRFRRMLGLYGEVLPNQDGAPIRLIVPWKYGFKSAKSIVKIKFLAKQPSTTWNDMAPDEYGFYSNVNPSVDHPRWSQKTERRLGSGFFPQIKQTLPFNGYADQVAGLYTGMDLRKNF